MISLRTSLSAINHSVLQHACRHAARLSCPARAPLSHEQVARLHHGAVRAAQRQPLSLGLTVVALRVERHNADDTRSHPHIPLRVASLHVRLRSRFFTTAEWHRAPLLHPSSERCSWATTRCHYSPTRSRSVARSALCLRLDASGRRGTTTICCLSIATAATWPRGSTTITCRRRVVRPCWTTKARSRL